MRVPITERGLVRAGIETYLLSALSLVANLVSGIVSARALGPDGRGVTVALVTVTQLAGFLFAMGVATSLSYYIARRPQDGPSLLTTWVLMLLLLTVVAIGVAELLLPTIFAGEEEAVTIGRWFMFNIAVVIALEFNYGLLLGAQDFLVYNVLRFAQPLLMAVSRRRVGAGRADREERGDRIDRRGGPRGRDRADSCGRQDRRAARSGSRFDLALARDPRAGLHGCVERHRSTRRRDAARVRHRLQRRALLGRDERVADRLPAGEHSRGWWSRRRRAMPSAARSRCSGRCGDRLRSRGPRTRSRAARATAARPRLRGRLP